MKNQADLAVSSASLRGGPPGITWVAAAEQGLARIQLGGTREEWLADLGRAGLRIEREPAWVERAISQIDEYYRGKRQRFSLLLWLRGISDFSLRAYESLRDVPYGEVLTYGALALRVGAPGAARAVGRAMATNPLPLVVPCHRVVGAGGNLVGFGGGIDLKRALLQLEGVSPGS